MSYYVILFGLFTFGFAAIFTGVMLRLGRLRSMYALQSMPVYAQREVFNISIPIGLINLIIALMIIRSDFKDLLTYPLGILFFTTVILAMWQPWWLKPAWLRWLEHHYGHVLEEMFAEARAMGRHKWADQVKTQAGLEAWADRVAQKNGWQRLSQQ